MLPVSKCDSDIHFDPSHGVGAAIMDDARITIEGDEAAARVAGAGAAILTPALIRRGVGHLRHVLTDLRHWTAGKESASVGRMRGALRPGNVPDPTAFERGNDTRVLRQGVGPSW